jgi:Fic family protein
MTKTIDKRQEILNFIQEHPSISSSELKEGIEVEMSVATIKRVLQELVKDQLIISSGNGKATRYSLSPGYRLLKPIDAEAYFKKEIDERQIQGSYHPTLVRDLQHAKLFTPDELNRLQQLQNQYEANISRLSETEFKNEMERLAIDLSWKSSQIEGNTYSLLETERLLKDKETAAGKSKDEAVMLLNHKESLDFIVEHPDYVNPLTVRSLEDIHSILVKELAIDRNVRNHRVGITGTNYRPLDNAFQIREALQDMCDTINAQDNVFAKALLSLVLISYIQPFADGNKRTARIVSNALLIHNRYCPISFRTVDSVEYKKAMLVFYEQNNIYPFKKIFMTQFEFAVETYF